MKNELLLFCDDFDGNDLDYAKWKRCREEPRQEGAAIWNNAMSFLGGQRNLVLRAFGDSEKIV